MLARLIKDEGNKYQRQHQPIPYHGYVKGWIIKLRSSCVGILIHAGPHTRPINRQPERVGTIASAIALASSIVIPETFERGSGRPSRIVRLKIYDDFTATT